MKAAPEIAQRDAQAPWEYLILTFGLLLVWVLTLFPFDFVFQPSQSLWDFISRFDLTLTQPYALADFPRNMLLFLPFGFGLAGVLRKWRVANRPVVGISLASGALLSLLVEILQLYLALRVSTVADILANSLGAFLGTLVFLIWGKTRPAAFNPSFLRFGRSMSAKRLAILFLGYIAMVVVGVILLQNRSRLWNWDPSFRLILGNEATGDRPWQGTIAEVFLASRAFRQGEVEQVYSKRDPVSFAGEAIWALYRFSKPAPYPSQGSWLPDLVWHGNFPDDQEDPAVSLDKDSWLATELPVTSLNQAIRRSSQFTLGIIASSANGAQTGPARIFSISADPYHRNLTLGQEGADLVIRMRNSVTGENGRNPELVIPGVFSTPVQRQIILTYDNKILRVFLDKAQNPFTFEFTPATNLAWLLAYPKSGGVRLNSNYLVLSKLLVYSLVFLPLGYYIAHLITGKISPNRGE